MEEKLTKRDEVLSGALRRAMEQEEARLRRPLLDDVNLLNFVLAVSALGIGCLVTLLR